MTAPPTNQARVPLRPHSLDGARLWFGRDSGLNVLERTGETAACERVAPRLLQVGLLTACNLSCSFCYRDQQARSLLTRPFLLELLQQAADWGVLEVAFGGGEPLLFRELGPLVRELHDTTPLALSMTTNGTRLSAEWLDEVAGALAEVRVSAYPDNGYRHTLELLRTHNQRCGVNWLITPDNLGMLEPTLYDMLERGADNVLLLGYKGADPTLHLGDEHQRTLRDALLRMQHLPLRLDICWYPLLADVPHLFAQSDCGAGDEFLVITPDKCVQACSFQKSRIPFETLDDLKRIYAKLRKQKPHADTTGCTRQSFASVKPSYTEPKATHYAWHAFSSNNSGDWTIVGQFRTASEARRLAEALRRLVRDHERFSSSDYSYRIGHAWGGSHPSTPLRFFGVVHGFEWHAEGEGLMWDMYNDESRVLTAGSVGDAVVLYHEYCLDLPTEPFTRLFDRHRAVAHGSFRFSEPSIRITARGENADATASLRNYFERLAQSLSPTVLDVPPPWGREANDPRIAAANEDASALPARHDTPELEETATGIHVRIRFANTFAGAVAFESWLVANGFEHVEARVETDQLEACAPADAQTMIGERFVAAGHVRAEHVEAARAQQRNHAQRVAAPPYDGAFLEPLHPQRYAVLDAVSGPPLGEVLLESGAIDEAAFLAVVAEHLGVEAVRLTDDVLDPALVAATPPELVRGSRILPYRQTPTHIYVAMARPQDLDPLGEIRLRMRRTPVPQLALARDIDQAFARHHSDSNAVESYPSLAPGEVPPFDRAVFLAIPTGILMAERVVPLRRDEDGTLHAVMAEPTSPAALSTLWAIQPTPSAIAPIIASHGEVLALMLRVLTEANQWRPPPSLGLTKCRGITTIHTSDAVEEHGYDALLHHLERPPGFRIHDVPRFLNPCSALHDPVWPWPEPNRQTIEVLLACLSPHLQRAAVLITSELMLMPDWERWLQNVAFPAHLARIPRDVVRSTVTQGRPGPDVWNAMRDLRAGIDDLAKHVRQTYDANAGGPCPQCGTDIVPGVSRCPVCDLTDLPNLSPSRAAQVHTAPAREVLSTLWRLLVDEKSDDGDAHQDLLRRSDHVVDYYSPVAFLEASVMGHLPYRPSLTDAAAVERARYRLAYWWCVVRARLPFADVSTLEFE